MFHRRPEIHCQRAYLDFDRNRFRSLYRLYRISHNNVVTPVAAVLFACNIILFAFNRHIRTFFDQLHNLIYILDKLTDNPHPGDILDILFNLLNVDAFFLRLFQDAGDCFDPSGHLFDRRIFPRSPVSPHNMIKFYLQLVNRQLVRFKNLPPQLNFHSISPSGPAPGRAFSISSALLRYYSSVPSPQHA